ncbi:MAG: cytochrome-c oxidase [Betaproteobacteria bacterium]
MNPCRPQPRMVPGGIVRWTCVMLSCVFPAGHAHAADAVKRVAIYVTPYYESARDPGGATRVAIGSKELDALLASPRVEDIARARDLIARNNGMLTPMTLMVLAIRLYDVALRNDAVFWFYAAKNRYATLAVVADVRAPQLSQVADAIRNFATLAGPVINGYAFCDVGNQQKIAAGALQWVIDNPYGALFLPQVPAQPGDRSKNLDRALAELKASVAKERVYLGQPANVAQLQRQRRENGTDQKYCWK